MSETSGGRPAGIQVIARAAQILRALRDSPAGLTQVELAQQVGLARTTVHRVLGALQDEGLVSVAGRRGRYRIGQEIARMAQAVRADTLGRMRPYLHELSHEVGETVGAAPRAQPQQARELTCGQRAVPPAGLEPALVRF